MQILGQLKEDILNNKAVLFLGAGASQSAGFDGAKGLAGHLFNMAGGPTKYENLKNDLSRLVAKLDKDQYFTRKWVNNQLIEYFLGTHRKLDLDSHKKLLEYGWMSIFTTNYDTCLELAEHEMQKKRQRILPIVNPRETASILSADQGKLKYFKIHGCCRELEQHPNTSPPLVITQSDFRESIARNKPFMEELARYAYDCSIIFVGFQAHRAENNFILANVIEAYQIIASSFHQPFKAFVVLKDVNEIGKSDIEDAGLILLEGSFEEFVDSIAQLSKDQKGNLSFTDLGKILSVQTLENCLELTLAEYKQFSSQFTFYYDSYFQDEAKKLEALTQKKLIELWKSSPSNMILSKGYYINRSIYNDSKKVLLTGIQKVIQTRGPVIVFITGKRASGKSTLARQLLAYVYQELHQPVLILSHQASYVEDSPEPGKSISISGWNARQVDKFLSGFYDNEDENLNVVPTILADHLFHRLGALDHLLTYLENHGKPAVLILTLNDDEYEQLNQLNLPDRMLQLYENQHIKIPHKLEQSEISALFEVISRLDTRVLSKKEELIDRAVHPKECDRDILLILYTWFDKQFRRLDDIMAEEIEKLDQLPELKQFYLSVAAFHQYNFSPSIGLCAEAMQISIDDFSDLRSQPNFKAMIDVETQLSDSFVELVATRHSEFSRRVLNKLVPDTEAQIELVCRVLSHCGKKDLQFARDFLNYVCRYQTLLTVDQVTLIKEATEKRLGNDYLLNHFFAAYLIRERTRLEDARYYLDLALQEDGDNPAVIHSLGNLCYVLYKNNIETDQKKALEYYDMATDYFSKSRALMMTLNEHPYYTQIDMMAYRINNQNINEEEKVLLRAEQQALTFEALRVVPLARQNLLRESLGQGVPFNALPSKDRLILEAQINSGKASPLLLEYYAHDLLKQRNKRFWQSLADLVSIYWHQAKQDATTAIIVSSIAKRAFIKNAVTRFELLRGYFDQIVRFRDTKINFALLAEYVRLIYTDAIGLQKYDFVHRTTGDIIDVFRESKPRFLEEEYILPVEYYDFDENNESLQRHYYSQKISFYSSNGARRYESLVNIDQNKDLIYFTIQLDPITRYYIKGVRKEVAVRGKVTLNFCIKYTWKGFIATDFRT